MIISIINTTSLHRQEVQDKLRAVNRQLQEDFRRYWHTDVQLRLEGWTGETLDPNRPLNMRGDAVIYLWGDDNTANALGYHDRTYRGVPFGFVFTHLSELLGEDWSVTLSHEALELALDAEINRLVQGPHPDPGEGGRIVYHWYELCDAVQADTYCIDGVKVSNFVLPLYFTSSEEHLNHNDFLGLGVQSFGVRPGGYVGFFDPDKGDHDTYHVPDDEVAGQRLAEKAKFANVKRMDRRGGSSKGDVLNDPRWVTCDAISFELDVETSDPSSLLGDAQRIVTQNLGESWLVRACAGDPNEFDAVHTGVLPLTFADAWNLTHSLEDEQAVVYAEPSFTFPIPGETDAPDDDRRVRRSSSLPGNTDKPGTDNHSWALNQCKVPAAWALIKESGKKPGEGILIGHPDSGFIEHPEMDLKRVRIDFDRDFIEDDFETRTEKVNHGRHGLATASVIMSGRGDTGDKISGPAYHAEILPLRVTKPRYVVVRAPILNFGGMRRLRDAVYYAVRHGCQVISISLGGLLKYRGLQKAIQRANAAGVIICAAAGNKVGFVVYPARYEETIAVAGCNINRSAWEESSKGSAVDVTAPAESVWRATVSEDGKRVVKRSNGTSYAVALTASIAAMWRSYRRDELAKRDPKEIPELFRQLLKDTASTEHHLPEGFGAGIIDAEALLRAPIPQGNIVQTRPSPTKLEANDIFSKPPDLPDTLERELLCAESLAAMIGASEQVVARGRQTTLRRARDNAWRLSTRLTDWLEHSVFR